MKKYVLVFLFNLCFTVVFSQAYSFVDAGQAFLKLVLENNNESFVRIDNYKVSGTPYLFGKNVGGNAFLIRQQVTNAALSYNTYTQKLEVQVNESNQFIEKSPSQVDSFNFVANNNTFFKENYNFISSTYYGEKKPKFLLKLISGEKFDLLKSYYSELAMISTNYIQSDLRQFELKYDYYYVDKLSNNAKLLPLKTNKTSLIKIFNTHTGALSLINSEDYRTNNETILKDFFIELNK